MNDILRLIETRSEQLSNNPLCQWILSEEAKSLFPEQVLSFAPSMLFFIMGFRDILQHLEYPQPRGEIEKIVNRHCQEDKDHWRWYLEDLKTLGFVDPTPGADFTTQIETMWHDRNKPTRDLVYLCIYLIRRYRAPKASFVIIECLEATFGVFMTALEKRFASSSVYQKLHFFGRTHHQQEISHSMGHWIGEGALTSSSPWELAQFSAEEEGDMMTVVQLIFEQFELVFEIWLSSCSAYSKKDRFEADLLEFT
jgi:hypothetical protein